MPAEQLRAITERYRLMAQPRGLQHKLAEIYGVGCAGLKTDFVFLCNDLSSGIFKYLCANGLATVTMEVKNRVHCVSPDLQVANFTSNYN